MHIISRKALVDYWTANPETEQPLKSWYDEAIKAEWGTPQDIKNQYGSASIVGKNRVVFNIHGNHHRLVVAIAYKTGWIFVKFLGTHAQYDKIDVTTVELE